MKTNLAAERKMKGEMEALEILTQKINRQLLLVFIIAEGLEMPRNI